MISMRISRIVNLLSLFLAFAAACAIVIAIWLAMGIVLSWLLLGIDLGIATIICSLAFVFVLSVISFFSRTSLIASLRDDAERGEEFDDDDDEEWEHEPTRHWNPKTQRQRRAQRRRSRNK